jgi:hypothetical protein
MSSKVKILGYLSKKSDKLLSLEKCLSCALYEEEFISSPIILIKVAISHMHI